MGTLHETITIVVLANDACTIEFVEFAFRLIFAAVARDFFASVLVFGEFDAAFVALVAAVLSVVPAAQDGLLVVLEAVAAVVIVVTVSIVGIFVLTIILLIVVTIPVVPVAGFFIIIIIITIMIPVVTVVAVVSVVPVVVSVAVTLLPTTIKFVLNFASLAIVAFRELSSALLHGAVSPLITWVPENVTEDAMALLFIKLTAIFLAAALGIAFLVAVCATIQDTLIVLAKEVVHHVINVKASTRAGTIPTPIVAPSSTGVGTIVASISRVITSIPGPITSVP